MFEGLFDEEDSACYPASQDPACKKGPPPPTPERSSCGLVGLANQGATCYLNCLIQSLKMTPEFRNGLFRLIQEQHGSTPPSRTGHSERSIPKALQNIFAKLVLSNKQFISTEELTASFGWKNLEHLEQQDIQELVQVLFPAIEKSLEDTCEPDLIGHLFRGNQVVKITCSECSHESDTKEPYVGVTVPVVNSDRLEDGLAQLFCQGEELTGSNQYLCDRCCRKVDAQRTVKLRSAPPIFIFMLNRIVYDKKWMTRRKEDKAFGYPTELNMAPYMETPQTGNDDIYDLYSVVMHKGSPFGGHYHAYIRDVEALGNWTPPATTSKGAKQKPASEILVDLLNKEPKGSLPLERLSRAFTTAEGATWTKKYASKWGSLSEFIENHNELFLYDKDTREVRLKKQKGKEDTIEPAPRGGMQARVEQLSDCPSSNMPPAGERWFDFNDNEVTSVNASVVIKLGKKFGTSCMFFYRRRSLCVEPKGLAAPHFGVPEPLYRQVMQENAAVEEEREEYSRAMHEVQLELHSAANYECTNRVLTQIDPDIVFNIKMDSRQSIAELKTTIAKELAGHIPDNFTLHRMEKVESQILLHDKLDDASETTLQELDLTDQAKIFVWDGESVKGVQPFCGPHSGPLSLTIRYADDKHVRLAFCKTMAFESLKLAVTESTDIPLEELVLRKVIGRDRTTVLEADDEALLADLPLADGDELMAGSLTPEEQMNTHCELMVENRFPSASCEANLAWLQMRVPYSSTVGELKAEVMAAYGVDPEKFQARIRQAHPSGGLKPPVNEALTVSEAAIRTKSTLVLEPGRAPTQDEMMIFYEHAGEERETVVRRDQTVEAVVQQIMREAQLPGKSWFLRRTNWCGDPADPLDDPHATLEQCEVYSGDHVALEMGSLPAKNCVMMKVILCPPVHNDLNRKDKDEVFDLVTAMEKVMKSTSQVPGTHGSRLDLGQVQIAKTATVQELRDAILQLPNGTQLEVPFQLRLRKLEQDVLGPVLRDPQAPLSKYKVIKAGVVAAQAVTQQDDPKDMLLQLVQRVPGARKYYDARELSWHAPKTISPMALRSCIADRLDIPQEYLLTAKYFPAKLVWLPFDGVQENVTSKKGKKSGSGGVNLRQAPYHLQDGDIIGVKDLRTLEPDDGMEDFATDEDDAKIEERRRQNEIKRTMRMKRRQGISEGGSRPWTRQTKEKGIVIQVDPFV